MAQRDVYLWVDGVHFNIRLEDDRQCILVVMGATKDGKKELVAIADGYRESAQSWREILLDLKARGLEDAPALAIGDGALGFWKALAEGVGSSSGITPLSDRGARATPGPIGRPSRVRGG